KRAVVLVHDGDFLHHAPRQPLQPRFFPLGSLTCILQKSSSGSWPSRGSQCANSNHNSKPIAVRPGRTEMSSRPGILPLPRHDRGRFRPQASPAGSWSGRLACGGAERYDGGRRGPASSRWSECSAAEALMTWDALTERVGELTDAVLADPRWEQDDLSVSV